MASARCSSFTGGAAASYGEHGYLLRSHGFSRYVLLNCNLFTALATHVFNRRLPLLRRMPVVRPFPPSNIQFLDEEAALCHLQSYFCGKLSIVAPTIRDQLFVGRQ